MKREKLTHRGAFSCGDYTKRQLDDLIKFYNESASSVISRLIQEQHLRLKIEKKKDK